MLIYAAIGAFGLLFLLLMLFVGEVFGGDHDVGSVDAADGHGDFGHEGGPSIFSTRIMASFLTAFGAGGVVGRYLGWSHPAASGLGVVTGIGLASAVYQFAHLLYSQQASSEVHMTDLVGQTAEVVVGIPAHGVGQVGLVVHGERNTQIARSRDGTSIPVGTAVLITGLSGEGVTVERRSAGAVARGGRS
jgi:membrane protein implicated in regulation of membrane protease activity